MYRALRHGQSKGPTRPTLVRWTSNGLHTCLLIIVALTRKEEEGAGACGGVYGSKYIPLPHCLGHCENSTCHSVLSELSTRHYFYK